MCFSIIINIILIIAILLSDEYIIFILHIKSNLWPCLVELFLILTISNNAKIEI